MSLFHFRKKPAPEAQKQERMWELWAKGQAAPPYQQLMTYQAEVNNGGHAQFFFNTDNTETLDTTIKELLRVLPATLSQNLQTASQAYRQYRDMDEEHMDEILSDCDHVFYANGAEINTLLNEYADTMRI